MICVCGVVVCNVCSVGMVYSMLFSCKVWKMVMWCVLCRSLVVGVIGIRFGNVMYCECVSIVLVVEW